MRTLRVYPDAARVEQALIDHSLRSSWVSVDDYLSFKQLVDSYVPKGKAPLTSLGARYCVAKLVRDFGDSPFGAWSHDIAFAQSVVETFTQLESEDASADPLERAARQVSSVRALWIAGLWRKFQATKLRLGVASDSDRLREATQVVKRKAADETAIELEGLYELNAAQSSFVEALPDAHARVHLRLPRADNTAVDAWVNEIHARFEKNASSSLDLEGFVPDSPFAHLKLFSPDAKPGETSGLSVFSADTSAAEAREIARRVTGELGRGTPLENIAVVGSLTPERIACLGEAFGDFKIPLKIRRTLSFASTPLGQLVLSLPLLAEESLPVEAVTRVLASRYLTSIWEPDLDAGRYFHLAGIRDDRVGATQDSGAYQVRLAQLAGQLSVSKDSPRAGEVRRAALQIERLKKALEGLRGEGSLEQHLAGFERTVERLGLRPANDVEGKSQLGHLVDEAQQEEQGAWVALKALVPMMRETARVVEALSVKMSRREFSRWLTDAASELSFIVPAPRVGAVTALDFREVSGRKFSHIFMIGMNEGEESGFEPPRGVLTLEEQAELNTAARATLFRMSSGETAARLPLLTAKQRLDFFLGLCASSHHVTFSFARRELLGRTLSMSPLLQEVLRLNPSLVVERIPLGGSSDSHSALSEREWRLKVSGTDVAKDVAWGADCSHISEMETERLKFFSVPTSEAGEFSGRVDAELLQPLLAFQADRPLTSARLGLYGNCAFQGFLGDVLGVRADEEQGEDLSSSSKGSLVHQVLEVLLPVLQGPFPANLEDTVVAAVEEVAQQHEKTAAVGHPMLWELQKKRITREVVAMLESERALPFEGVKPEKAEWKFAEELPRVGVVAGKVDRIDVGGQQAFVIDYKTARIEGNADRVRRLFVQEWQIPIYAWAVQKAGLGSQVDGAWVSTREGVKKLSTIAEEFEVTLEELLSFDPLVQERLVKEAKPNLGIALATLVDRLRGGDLSPKPSDCEYCPYRAVCRISSRKLHDEGW